ESVLLVDAIAERVLDQLPVLDRAARVRGLVHDAVDDDHLPGEPARLDRARALTRVPRAEEERALRVDRFSCDLELPPRQVVGRGLGTAVRMCGDAHVV